MTPPSIVPHFRTLRVVALLVIAALLLPASSFRDANSAEPSGGASTNEPNGTTFQRDSELSNIRRMMLEELTVHELQLRKAQAALKAAKDTRSKAMHQAEVDAIVASQNRLYASVIVNRLSLDALYAPPTLGKRLEELAKRLETDLKARFSPTSVAELEPKTLQRELELLKIRRRMLDEVAVIAADSRTVQSDLEATNDARRKAAMQVEPQKVELARQQAQLQTVLDGLRQQQAAFQAEPDAQEKARLQAALDAQEKAAVQAEKQYRETAQRQAVLQTQFDTLRYQQAKLQAKLKDSAAMRSQRCAQLAANRWEMDVLSVPPDVSEQIWERLAQKRKKRDRETVHTIGRLVVASERLRQIGRAAAADRLSREAELIENEITVLVQPEKEPSPEPPGDSAPPQPERAPATKVIELRLLDNEQVLVNRRGKIMLGEFKKQLGDAMAGYKQQGVQPSAVRVHLSAAENVSCGRFEQLIEDCWENRIEHYVLTIEAIYLDPAPRDKRLENAPPINIKFSLPRETNAVAEEAVLPLLIRLLAKEDGSLAGIRVGEIQLRRLDQLRIRAVELKRKAVGSPAPLTAEFDTDEKLAFKYLAEAVLAVSVEVDPFHKFVPLIENVVPIRLPVAFEHIEEFEGVIDRSDNPETSPPPSIQLDNIKLDPLPKR